LAFASRRQISNVRMARSRASISAIRRHGFITGTVLTVDGGLRFTAAA
jgi:hypothetical protein